jgi:hypothetical protein
LFLLAEGCVNRIGEWSVQSLHLAGKHRARLIPLAADRDDGLKGWVRISFRSLKHSREQSNPISATI